MQKSFWHYWKRLANFVAPDIIDVPSYKLDQ